MKAVSGGMKWAVVALIIGAVAVTCFIVFSFFLGESVVDMIGPMISGVVATISDIVGRIPIFGIFLRG